MIQILICFSVKPFKPSDVDPSSVKSNNNNKVVVKQLPVRKPVIKPVHKHKKLKHPVTTPASKIVPQKTIRYGPGTIIMNFGGKSNNSTCLCSGQ